MATVLMPGRRRCGSAISTARATNCRGLVQLATLAGQLGQGSR